MDKEAMPAFLQRMRDRYYGPLSRMYGPRRAKGIIAAGAAGLPLPVPGSSAMTAAPVLAAAKMTHGMPLTRQVLGDVKNPAFDILNERFGAQRAEGFANFMGGKTAAARHHLPLVSVQRRDGKVKVCPHCHQEVSEGSIYRDAKGWCFHRPCFTNGKGSIDLEKNSSVAHRVLLGSLAGGALGAYGKSKGLPISPLSGAALGGTAGLMSDYVVPSVSPIDDTMAHLPEDRRRLLQQKFKNITDTLSREGVYIGTQHKRVVVPHEYMGPQDLQDLGFLRSSIAVPEQGQAEFSTWRHPSNLYHFHNHPHGWTVHEDFFPSMDMLRYSPKSPLQRLFTDLPRGIKHVVIEGVPGYANYLKNRVKEMVTGKKSRGMVRSILKENPNALVKSSAETEVVPQPQTNDYNCGPAVLKSVENTMGVGHPDIKSYEADTKADEDNGTPIPNLEQAAAGHGLQVNSQGQMDLNQLAQAVQAHKPVIVAVQLDGKEGGPRDGWNAGHYVVVTGVDGQSVKFMDPNAQGKERVWPVDEFVARWHDHDGQGKVYQQWGMTLHHPGEVKEAYSGSLGTSGGSGTATDPPKLVDATGATPAGPENQPASDAVPCDSTHLDRCEQEPDPLVFDTAALQKMATIPFEMMSVGTEETQEAADNTGAQWTGRHSRDTVSDLPWRDRLRQLVEPDPSYQDSGAAGAGGVLTNPSGPAFQSGQSAQNSGATSAPAVEDEPHMQLDSDTISTGQVPHLNA